MDAPWASRGSCMEVPWEHQRLITEFPWKHRGSRHGSTVLPWKSQWKQRGSMEIPRKSHGSYTDIPMEASWKCHGSSMTVPMEGPWKWKHHRSSHRKPCFLLPHGNLHGATTEVLMKVSMEPPRKFPWNHCVSMEASWKHRQSTMEIPMKALCSHGSLMKVLPRAP